MPTNPSVIVTLIVQIILALVLIVVVLFQSGNEEGLSSSIAGGSSNFFGKNKGKTADAKLKKLTAWVAVLFLVSSVLLGLFVQQSMPATVVPTISTETLPEGVEVVPADTDVEITPEATPEAVVEPENAQN